MSADISELHSRDDLRRIYSEEQCQPQQDLTVACYYFPHYQRSALNDELYGHGWTEHVLRRAARPWFPGHRQPRVPMWDEHDEGDPQVMAPTSNWPQTTGWTPSSTTGTGTMGHQRYTKGWRTGSCVPPTARA